MTNTLPNIFIMNAHPVSVLLIVFTIIFVSMYWFWLVPLEKAKKLAIITLIIGTLTITASFFNLLKYLGNLGGPVILLLWIVPFVFVWKFRNYFINIDQKPLIFLQIFRLIGGLFILEMYRGYIPSSFALPAGIGDIVVGLIALVLFFSYKKIPRWGIIAVLFLGILDFASALFFGFTSQPGPAQLFAFGFDNQVNLFPTGIIPIFLVPYAIVFHVLSFINLKYKGKIQCGTIYK